MKINALTVWRVALTSHETYHMAAGKTCDTVDTMVLRIDSDGRVLRGGDQIKVGGNESYVSVCRRHFKDGLANPFQPTLPFGEQDED